MLSFPTIIVSTMKWNNSHTNPPKHGQKVYYFGKNIGLWVGTYTYEETKIPTIKGKEVELCPHVFRCDDGWGNVDACDAPYWLPYDSKREKQGWRPIVPECFTKDLYDD